VRAKPNPTSQVNFGEFFGPIFGGKSQHRTPKSQATVSLKRDCKNDLIFDLNMNEEYAIKTVSLITGNFGINYIWHRT